MPEPATDVRDVLTRLPVHVMPDERRGAMRFRLMAAARARPSRRPARYVWAAAAVMLLGLGTLSWVWSASQVSDIAPIRLARQAHLVATVRKRNATIPTPVTIPVSAWLIPYRRARHAAIQPPTNATTLTSATIPAPVATIISLRVRLVTMKTFVRKAIFVRSVIVRGFRFHGHRR